MIASQKWEKFKDPTRKRWELEAVEQEKKREHFWQLARHISNVLKEKYGASQVAIFGSLARNERLYPHSDIDIAVWGLPETGFFRIWADLYSQTSPVRLDLLSMEDVPPLSRQTIEKECVWL